MPNFSIVDFLWGLVQIQFNSPHIAFRLVASGRSIRKTLDFLWESVNERDAGCKQQRPSLSHHRVRFRRRRARGGVRWIFSLLSFVLSKPDATAAAAMKVVLAASAPQGPQV